MARTKATPKGSPTDGEQIVVGLRALARLIVAAHLAGGAVLPEPPRRSAQSSFQAAAEKRDPCRSDSEINGERGTGAKDSETEQVPE